MGFARRTIKKADKIAAYQFALVDTTLVIYYPIASKFIYGLLLSNSWPSFNMGFLQ